MRAGWARLRTRGFAAAFSSVLILFMAAVLVSYAPVAGTVAGGGGMLGGPLGDGTHAPLYFAILLRNSAVVLGLFAGVLTAGIGSLLGIAFFGFLVGASTAAAATEIGLGAAISSVIGYSIIEIPAMLLAATAGVLPVATALLPSAPTTALKPLSRYLEALPGALTLLMVALLLIAAGAGVEAFLITKRRV